MAFLPKLSPEGCDAQGVQAKGEHQSKHEAATAERMTRLRALAARVNLEDEALLRELGTR